MWILSQCEVLLFFLPESIMSVGRVFSIAEECANVNGDNWRKK